MNIKVIGSGSSGNCYRIDDGKTALLLEAGLPIKKIKEGCDYNLASVAGCLISHSHGDHSKAARDVMITGLDLYCSKDTAAECALDGHYRLNIVEPEKSFRISSLIVLPFPVHHDVTTFGYLIYSIKTGEKLLFVTDTYYIDYHFNALTHIMLEANYSADTLADADNDPRRRRLLRSHMSIENCIELLKANDLSRVREIWLLHLSTSNGDAEGFKRQVQEATGCEVYVA